jgi:hypothetical protein
MTMASRVFSHHRNGRCRFCGGTDLEPYLDLGSQPPSNSFLAAADVAQEQAFPLSVHLCRGCGLSQLVDVVHAEDIFDEYAYLSTSSKALCDYYQTLVSSLLARLEPSPGALVADVGANDGIMLDRYPKGVYRAVGVEPSSAGEVARAKGHVIEQAFFGRETAKRLRGEHGPVSIVTATNVLAHVDDTHDFAAGFAEWLADDGVAVFEFPYILDTIEQTLFDTVYHEHLGYLGLTPLTFLFAKVGLRAWRVERTSFGASGPALRLFACRESSPRPTDGTVVAMLEAERVWGIREAHPYRDFAARVESVLSELRRLVAELRASGKRVGAYTAPAKGNTLLNSARFTAREIELVAENNERKIGKLTPGSHIPIVSDEEFLRRKPDVALLLSWNYADFFLRQSPYVHAGGKFLVPLPHPVLRP